MSRKVFFDNRKLWNSGQLLKKIIINFFLIFENLILEVKIFGSKIISILLNDIENCQNLVTFAKKINVI